MTRKPDTEVKKSQKPEDLLTAKSAAEYMNISRQTFYRLINDDKIKPIETPDGARYKVRDCEKAKAFVGAYAGKRGRASGTQRMLNADADAKAVEEKKEVLNKIKDRQLTDKILHRSDEEIEGNREDVLSKLTDQVVHMANETDIVAQLFAMLESPIESTRTRGIDKITDILFKKQKTEDKPKQPWETELSVLDGMVEAANKEHSIAMKVTYEQRELEYIEP